MAVGRSLGQLWDRMQWYRAVMNFSSQNGCPTIVFGTVGQQARPAVRRGPYACAWRTFWDRWDRWDEKWDGAKNVSEFSIP